MTETRPLQPADLPAVAALFTSIMRGSSAPPTEALRGYLRHLFLDGPAADSAIPSQVYIRNDGSVGGFIGVTVQTLQAGALPLRAATCGTLMVRDHRQDPLAGARLLRAFLAGPQDVSLSETAGDASLAMWRQCGGTVLPLHSLDWVRVIRPASFAVRTLQTRLQAAGLLAPLASALDGMLGRNSKAGTLRWSSLPAGSTLGGGLLVEPLEEAAAAEAVKAMVAVYSVVPRWSDAELGQILADAARKSLFGELRRCKVRNRNGQTIGTFQYHLRPGGIARLLYLLALPGNTGRVLDAALADAAEGGAAALRGRTDPQMYDALLPRRVLLLHTEASVIHSRDADLVAAFARGDAIFNGIVGERWTRLIGDRLD